MAQPAPGIVPGPEGARCGACGDERTLDDEGARAAHGIQETAPRRGDLGPARQEEEPRSQGLLEGRGADLPAPAAAVQRVPDQVHGHRRPISHQVDGEAQVRRVPIHRGAATGVVPESIHHPVLDDLCAEVGVGDPRTHAGAGHREGAVRREVAGPREVPDALAEGLGVRCLDDRDLEEDPTGRAAPEAGAVPERQVPGEGHHSGAGGDVPGAQEAQLSGEDLLQAPGGGCVEPEGRAHSSSMIPRKTSTTFGSNWEPAFRRISSTAASRDIATR